MTHPARLHRRRLHRRHRPRQQPGARRHARGADDRRAGGAAAARRRRCRRRRAQVAHHRRRPTRSRSRSPRCAGCRRSGATQIYFKYCSTFDSTPRGNIGPVTEALMDALGCRLHDRDARPFPDNARTVFKGHLFVGDVLLSESGMRNHPLTPMTDANLVRVLQAQLRRRATGAGAASAYVDHRATGARRGDRRAHRGAAQRGRRRSRSSMRSPTTTCMRLGAARARTCRWSCAGSGVAIGLPAQLRHRAVGRRGVRCRRCSGLRAIVSGSCSQATNAQVARLHRAAAARRWRVDPLALGGGARRCARARRCAWAEREWLRRRAAGARLHHRRRRRRSPRRRRRSACDDVGARSSACSPAIARGLVERGARHLVVAGGETSGAVRAGARRRAAAHRRADRSRRAVVPRRAGARRADGLHLALKSGNFGGVDFFAAPSRVLRMNESARCATRSAASAARLHRARLRARHDRQHQRAAATTAS